MSPLKTHTSTGTFAAYFLATIVLSCTVVCHLASSSTGTSASTSTSESTLGVHLNIAKTSKSPKNSPLLLELTGLTSDSTLPTNGPQLQSRPQTPLTILLAHQSEHPNQSHTATTPPLELLPLSDQKGAKLFSLRREGAETPLATLSITTSPQSPQCVTLTWTQETELWHTAIADDKQFTLQDCILLNPTYRADDNHTSKGPPRKKSAVSDEGYGEVVWYGGAETYESSFVSSATAGDTRISHQPFVSSDIYAETQKLGGVLEAFWVNSAGWTVEVDAERSESGHPYYFDNDTAVLSTSSAGALRSSTSLSSSLQTPTGPGVSASAGRSAGGIKGASAGANPLWISYKDLDVSSQPALCLQTAWSTFTRPHTSQDIVSSGLGSYSAPGSGLRLQYNVCANPNPYEAWRNNRLKKITGIPANSSPANSSTNTKTNLRRANPTALNAQTVYNGDMLGFQSPNIRMIERPIWSTWAEFKKDINQTEVINHARRISSLGYPYSVMEIGDMWMRAYGDLTFNETRFPNPKHMISELHALDFSVMLWVIPFCDTDAEVYEEGVRNRYWVMKRDSHINKPSSNNSGSSGDNYSNYTLTPARVKWWNNQAEGSAVLDVTNPAAVKWFISRLQRVKDELGVDGFKFDAGEVVYIPPLSDPTVVYHDIAALGNGSQPLAFTQLYANIVNSMGDFTEMRASWRTQQLGAHFVRIMDLDSDWGQQNGLKSVIPRVLLFSVLGYRYTLPDMIGGNGYGPHGELLAKNIPTAELYIRWLQMNLLLPMQLSISPWRFAKDPLAAEVERVFRGVLRTREMLLPYLREAVNAAETQGLPVARPMWFADPDIEAAYTVNDQYMIGDAIVFAPVLNPNTTERAIYLPTGSWKMCDDIEGLRATYSMRCEYLAQFNPSPSTLWNLTTAVVRGPAKCNVSNILLASATPCFFLLK